MGERVANPGPSCRQLDSILWSLKPMEDKDRADGGRKLEVLVLVRVSAVSNNLICVSRCSGKTFTYKVKDRTSLVMSCLAGQFSSKLYLILKNLTHSINLQMESIHIQPVWGRDQLYQRLCCCRQSPSLHCRSIAHLREGFRSRPCTVTRLQCGRFMAIPFRERTRKLSMRVCWLKEHYLR